MPVAKGSVAVAAAAAGHQPIGHRSLRGSPASIVASHHILLHLPPGRRRANAGASGNRHLSSA